MKKPTLKEFMKLYPVINEIKDDIKKHKKEITKLNRRFDRHISRIKKYYRDQWGTRHN